MGIKFSNNASANIIQDLTSTATSVSVTVGKGDLFPSLTEGDYFYATLAGNNGLEIVKVTNRVNDTMTIVRAQDDTTALSFDTGDLFELRIVAADFNDTFSEVDDKLEASIEETTSIVNSALSSKAPISHASSSTEFGTGTSTQYGHNKLSDATNSNLGAEGGTAATPLAVKTAKDEAVQAASSALEAFAEGQATKDEEQDAKLAEQDVKIAEALDKVGLPLGFEYTRLTGQTAPLGGVDYMGQTATRAMYADLWAWLNENKSDAIVSESEWQSLYTSQNGNVAKYSSGDGSTTFRFPRVMGHFKGAGSVDELGSYTPEGLPDHTHTRGSMNITGSFQFRRMSAGDSTMFNPDGVFTRSETNVTLSTSFNSDATDRATQQLNFDASRSWTGSTSSASESNPIYGNSNHVTPESVTLIMGVIAIGSVASIGEATEEGIVAELSEHGAKFAEYLPLSGGKMSGTIIADRDVLSGSELDQAITIKAHAGGPQLNLFGTEFSHEGNSDFAGAAELVAQKGTQRCSLAVLPNGILKGPDGRELPQYSRWANYAGAWWIGRTNTFTAPGPGWLSISLVLGNMDWVNTGKYITVNGVAIMRLFAYSGDWAGTCNNMLLPLNTGDVVAGLVQATSDMTFDTWFIPIK